MLLSNRCCCVLHCHRDNGVDAAAAAAAADDNNNNNNNHKETNTFKRLKIVIHFYLLTKRAM
jgi:hypothetical protein